MRALLFVLFLALPFNCDAEEALGAAEMDKLLCSVTQADDALKVLGSWGELEAGPKNEKNESYEVKTDKFKIAYYLENNKTNFIVSVKKASRSKKNLLKGSEEVNAYAAEITERLRPLSSDAQYPKLSECSGSYCKATVIGDDGWHIKVQDERVYLAWIVSKASLNKVFCK
jgi:hypothetical protein